MGGMGRKARRRALIAGLTTGPISKLEEILQSDRLSEFPDIDILNYEAAKSNYTINGVRRFYRGLLYDSIPSVSGQKPKSLLQKLSPIYHLSGFSAYDFILDKTNSHLLASGARGAVMMTSVMTGFLLASSYIVSTCLGIPASAGCYPTPFLQDLTLLGQFLLPEIIGYPIFGAAVAAGGVLGIVGAERFAFRGKGIKKKEIKDDIIRYARDFYDVFNRYASFLKDDSLKKDVSLAELDAVYLMASAKASRSFYYQKQLTPLRRVHDFVNKMLPKIKEKDLSVSDRFRNLYHSAIKYCYTFADELRKPNRLIREHEETIIPSIDYALGGKVSINSVSHICPEGVGGFTTIFPTAAIGRAIGVLRRAGVVKKTRVSGLLQRVYLNRIRISAAPEYDFALSHEFAHAAGAGMEPMANYYALKAMDDLDRRFPYQGYDIFAAVSRLCFAVGALRDKIKDPAEFLNKLENMRLYLDNGEEVKLPSFLTEAMHREFSPEISPVPPMQELLSNKISIEALFGKLYCGSSYIALKSVQKGLIKEMY